MRRIRIGGHEISRVICGSNPFNARSHFSQARSAEYAARFDDEGAGRVLDRALELGLNAYENSASIRAWDAVCRLRERSGQPVHFIGSTRIDETSPLRSHAEKLQLLIERRAEICVVHAQLAEQEGRGDDIPGLAPMLDRIHAAGLLAGVSAHRIATVERCERKGYTVDCYLFPLNPIGFVYPGYDGHETPQERGALIRSVGKPFILMKTLGAGRVPPDEGLPFAAEHAKPGDLVSIGFGSLEELEETVRIAERWLA